MNVYLILKIYAQYVEASQHRNEGEAEAEAGPRLRPSTTAA